MKELLHNVGLRLQPVLARFAARSSATAPDRVAALVLESARLHGAVFAAGDGGWTRAAAAAWPLADAAWPLAAPASEPATEPGAAPVAAGEPAAAPAAPDTGLATAFRAAREAFGVDTVSIALPASMLLVRVLRMPSLAPEEIGGAVALQMDKLSPFSGDEPTVGWEVLASGEEQTTVLAAAAPTRCLEAMGKALTGSGLRVARLDASLMAAWRLLCEPGVLEPCAGRRALLVAEGGEWDLLVVDNGLPVLARGLGALVDDGDLARELFLSLSQVEIDVGVQPLHEVVLVADTPPAAAVLEALREVVGGQIRVIAWPAGRTAADGLALRTREAAALDLTPPAWRTREESVAARRRLRIGLGAAAALWVVLAGVLALGPVVTAQMTRLQKQREAAILADFRRVSDMRTRVQLIHRYMDRSTSLLESLRTLAGLLPEGIELNSFTYRREDGCKLGGETTAPALVYAFIDQLRTNAPFADCKPGGVSAIPGTPRHRFELDALFSPREEQRP